MKALGMIEVYGNLIAVEALDSALKSADVSLLDLVKVGGGLVTVLVSGDVSATKAAIDTALAAAERIGEVISVSVIPRPDESVFKMLENDLKYFEKIRREKEKANEKETNKESEDTNKIQETLAFDCENSDTVDEAKQITDDSNCNDVQIVGVDELQQMKVVDLRKLARDLDIKTLSRKQIRYAQKKQLIEEILKFYADTEL